MGIQERITSIKQHKKEFITVALGIGGLAFTSCENIKYKNFIPTLQPIPYATPSSILPEYEIDGFKLTPNNQFPIKTTTEIRGCPNYTLGIRNDHPEMMDIIKKLCLGRVRIAIDIHTWNVKTEGAIKRAYELGYKVLGTLVTHGPNTKEEELLINLARKYPEMIFEIGNEIDNTPFAIPDDSPLLKDIPKEQKDEARLSIFADDFAEKYFKIKQINPNSKIILGATVDTTKTVRILELLQEKGIKREDLFVAIHAYHITDDIKDRINILIENRVNIKKIIITELGSNTKDKEVIIRMIKYARGRGIEVIYIHELPDFQEYGCPMINNSNNEYDLKDGTCNPIKEYAIEEVNRS